MEFFIGAVTAVVAMSGYWTLLAFFDWIERRRHARARVIAHDHRIDDLRELWRAELRRVEDVHNVRLKHLEDREHR